jgi:hypothetical protein
MDEMMNPSAIYGSVDPQPRENPYSKFQAFSGARLTAAGPTNDVDQTAYGNNDPTFYTDQLRNLNNQGPPSIYQNIQQGYGAGVSPTPSQFTPAYYLRIYNRGTRAVRVAKGAFEPSGLPAFQQPKSIDDSAMFEFPQATGGTKLPVLVELPSKAIYLKVVVVPTGQNQGQLYLPFETELIDRQAPRTSVGDVTVFADSPQELAICVAYLKQFSQFVHSGQQAGSLNTGAPRPAAQQQQAQAQQQARVQQAQQQAQAQQAQAQQAQAQQAQQQAQARAQAEVTQTAARPVQAPPAAPPSNAPPSLLMSALLIIGGAIASHYLEGGGE